MYPFSQLFTFCYQNNSNNQADLVPRTHKKALLNYLLRNIVNGFILHISYGGDNSYQEFNR